MFPRKHYHDHFVQSAPLGSAGSGNASGWMQENDFLLFLQHFQKHTKASRERKLLLLLEIHSSHTYCICEVHRLLLRKWYCAVEFPTPLQPLDRTVYGPFKRLVNSASDSWMKMNPAKPMTIYDIPGIIKSVFPN